MTNKMYKEKEDLPKTWVLTGKKLKISEKKK